MEVITVVGTVVASVVHTEVEGTGGRRGKTCPLARGMGKVGPDAVPTTLPFPGKVGACTAEAAAVAALAAWYKAALFLFLAICAGPRRLR